MSVILWTLPIAQCAALPDWHEALVLYDARRALENAFFYLLTKHKEHAWLISIGVASLFILLDLFMRSIGFGLGLFFSFLGSFLQQLCRCTCTCAVEIPPQPHLEEQLKAELQQVSTTISALEGHLINLNRRLAAIKLKRG